MLILFGFLVVLVVFIDFGLLDCLVFVGLCLFGSSLLFGCVELLLCYLFGVWVF